MACMSVPRNWKTGEAIHGEMVMENIQLTEARRLAIHFWELLAQRATCGYLSLATYNPDVTTSLVDAQEWDRLECWIFIAWMACPLEYGNVAKDMEDAMEVLEKERPGALQKLMQRMEQWRERYNWYPIPETFQQTCDKLTL